MPRDGIDELDELDRVFEVEPLPTDPWAAVLASAQLQAPDPVLEALLVARHGIAADQAAELIEQGHAEIVAHRRAGQLDLVQHAWAVVKFDPGSPPAVSLLKLLLGNHLGWSSTGIDKDMRRLMRQLERMTPAERAQVMASAAEVEGRA